MRKAHNSVARGDILNYILQLDPKTVSQRGHPFGWTAQCVVFIWGTEYLNLPLPQEAWTHISH